MHDMSRRALLGALGAGIFAGAVVGYLESIEHRPSETLQQTDRLPEQRKRGL